MSLTNKDNMRTPESLKFKCAQVLEDTYENMSKWTWNEGNSLNINLKKKLNPINFMESAYSKKYSQGKAASHGKNKRN